MYIEFENAKVPVSHVKEIRVYLFLQKVICMVNVGWQQERVNRGRVVSV